MSDFIHSQNPKAKQAFELVTNLQKYFVSQMEELENDFGQSVKFLQKPWLRNNGEWGGGYRFEAPEEAIFNRASANVSQVQYEANPQKTLESATAISTIIHPGLPKAPSVHMHISWTKMKTGEAAWRLMADLNPSLPNPEDAALFAAALMEAAPDHYEHARKNGDNYFYIPALERHRGTLHFYLEGYKGEDFATELAFAKNIGETVIDVYSQIIVKAYSKKAKEAAVQEIEAQRSYHTLYMLQVLTLDKGVTVGLLNHKDNDIGVLGCIPRYVDRKLLIDWEKKHTPLQSQLVSSLVEVLPEEPIVEITSELKVRLADQVRNFYKAHPEAAALQAPMA